LYRYGFQGEVLVGVWTGHDKIDALLSFCLSLSFNIRVIAQDGADRFTARILALAEQATGKYVLQSGDDDFLVPAPLATLARTLDSDTSIFSVQGRTLMLDLDLVHPDYRVYTFPQWSAPETDLLTRYANYLKHPGQMFHAMLRTADFIARCRLVDETRKHTKNEIWFEWMAELFTLIKGRFVVVDEIYMLRGKHVANTSHLLLAAADTRMLPHLLFSDTFTPTYKFFECQIFRVFSACGRFVAAGQPPYHLARFLDYMGALLFKRRGPPAPEELALAALLTQSPPHPMFVRIIDVKETRLPAP